MADSTDPNLEQNEGADNRPEWLPENFNSPEDLAKSYQEAQRKITELGQQNKGLEESIGELASQFDQLTSQQQAEQTPYDPNQDPWAVAYNQAMIEGDYTRAMTLNDQRTAAIVQQAVQQGLAQVGQPQPQTTPDVVAFIADRNLASQYEDWAQVKGDVAKIVETDPLFANDALWQNPAVATQALDRAYKLAKAESGGADLARQQAADTRAMKLAAQSATGALGRPDISEDAAKQRWQEIQNAGSSKLQF